MKKSISRILALTLALVMLLGAIPMVSAATCANDMHDYTVSTTKAATCSAAGSQTLRCKKCGTTQTIPIPKLEHTVSWSYSSTDGSAVTCAKDFEAIGTCTRCRATGDINNTRYYDASLKKTVKRNTHLVASWSYPESWDCTKSEVTLVGTCVICGKDDVTKTITIEPTKEQT